LDDARDLPSLPEVAVKVSRLADDPNASAASIARVIATDQGLTARILRLANSALYGVARRVGTVQEAVVILGLGTIRNLTLAASIYPALGAAVPGYDLAKGELWRHSVAAALCAQELARRMPRAPRPGAGAAPSAAVSPDEAFVAGLLHDIGKTLLSAASGDTSSRCASARWRTAFVRGRRARPARLRPRRGGGGARGAVEAAAGPGRRDRPPPRPVPGGARSRGPCLRRPRFRGAVPDAGDRRRRRRAAVRTRPRRPRRPSDWKGNWTP
jgi:hypothetical protein